MTGPILSRRIGVIRSLLKRILDISISFTAAVILLPVFAVIIVAIRVSSKGPAIFKQMSEWNERQKKRLLVKPGLTGLAQISGRGELTREEKLELDVKYVETTSFLADIKIILATIAQVFGRKSIYEKKYSQTEETRGEKK